MRIYFLRWTAIRLGLHHFYRQFLLFTFDAHADFYRLASLSRYGRAQATPGEEDTTFLLSTNTTIAPAMTKRHQARARQRRSGHDMPCGRRCYDSAMPPATSGAISMQCWHACRRLSAKYARWVLTRLQTVPKRLRHATLIR